MQDFYSNFAYAFASLFAMINPIGMSAVFLAMTHNYSIERRHRVAYKVALYGTILLVCTFFIGPDILRFFGISLSSIQVAGGMLVFYSAWQMLDTTPKINSEEQKEAEDKQTDNTFFPLTMPITAGAGSMAVTIALAARLTKTETYNLTGISATLAAMFVVFVIVGLCYRYADSIFTRLGHTGTNVISRLTAFILLAISITVIWDGILGLISPLMTK